jgi:hypothetical protein
VSEAERQLMDVALGEMLTTSCHEARPDGREDFLAGEEGDVGHR